MTYTIRTAVPKDAKRLCALFLEMLCAIHGAPASRSCQPEAWNRFFSSESNVAYVAESCGEVVAFLSVEGHREGDIPFVYLDDFSVTAAHRGLGIGTALLQKAECFARTNDYPFIILHAEESNTRAQALYLRHGFVPDLPDNGRVRMIKTL